MAASTGPSGRVALVVGAQRGIGFACARAFAEAGTSVALADLTRGAVEDARGRLGVGHSAHRIDLTEVSSIDRVVAETVERHGRIDVLVSTAGHLDPEPFLELTPAAWERTFAVNAMGSVFLAQAVARQLLAQGDGGRIIMFASIVGRHVVRQNNTAYCASKAAMIQAVRCMALELGPHGITVNTVSPGSTATEMLLDVQMGGSADAIATIVRGDASQWRLGIPLGRLADPADQAAMALFLAGDQAGHITGQDFVVDGGQSTV
jgi:NAD(P)-dependent dehydrogenase (short-subunit alcohol dehydrogenase family)